MYIIRYMCMKIKLVKKDIYLISEINPTYNS